MPSLSEFFSNNRLLSIYKDIESKDKSLAKVQLDLEQLQEKIEKILRNSQSNIENNKELTSFHEQYKKKLQEKIILANDKSLLQERFNKRKEELFTSDNREMQLEREEFDKYLVKQETQKIKLYVQNRDKIFKRIDSFSEDTKEMSDLIISVLGKVLKGNPIIDTLIPEKSLEKNAAKIIALNAGNLIGVALDNDFYLKKGRVLSDIISKKTSFDKNNPPFFISLLDDPKTNELIQNQNFLNILNNLIQEVLHNANKNTSDQTENLDKIANLKVSIFELDKAIKDSSHSTRELSNLKKQRAILAQEVKYLESKTRLIETLQAFKNAGFTQEVIEREILPFANGLIKDLTSQPDNLRKLLKNYINSILVDDTMKKEALSDTLTAGGDLLKSLSNMVKDQLPKFIVENKDKILEAATNLIDLAEQRKLPAQKIAPKQNISKTIINPIVELMPQALPIVYEIAEASLTKELSTDLAQLLDELALYRGVLEKISKANSKEKEKLLIEQQQKLSSILTTTGKIIPAFETTFNYTIPRFIHDNKEKITDAANNFLEQNTALKERLERFGISQEAAKVALGTVIEIAPQVQQIVYESAKELLKPDTAAHFLETITSFQKYDIISRSMKGKSPDIQAMLQVKQQNALSSFITAASSSLNALTPVLSDTLPEFIKTNKEPISLAIMKLIGTNPQIKRMIQANRAKGIAGISDSSITQAVYAGLDLIPDLLPLATEIGHKALAEKDALTNVINNYQEFAKAPKKEKSAKMDKFLDSVFILTNKAGIKETLDKELPALLAKHADSMGKVFEDFISTTEVGRKMDLEGKKLLKVLSKKLPQLAEIAELYHHNKRDYKTLIPKAIKILADREVLSLALKAAFGLIKYKVTNKNTEKPKSAFIDRILKRRKSPNVQDQAR
ncbi:MAG: hypothetical protein K0Q51_51 [Rickettsiaceae bacterium]|nr:hypothetical protein [Rickettsiaceae bacterium]